MLISNEPQGFLEHGLKTRTFNVTRVCLSNAEQDLRNFYGCWVDIRGITLALPFHQDLNRKQLLWPRYWHPRISHILPENLIVVFLEMIETSVFSLCHNSLGLSSCVFGLWLTSALNWPVIICNWFVNLCIPYFLARSSHILWWFNCNWNSISILVYYYGYWKWKFIKPFLCTGN